MECDIPMIRGIGALALAALVALPVAGAVPWGELPRSFEEARDQFRDLQRERQDLRERILDAREDCRDQEQRLRERLRDADSRDHRRDLRDDFQDLRRECRQTERRLERDLDDLRAHEKVLRRLTGGFGAFDVHGIADVLERQVDARAELAQLEARCELEERVLAQRARLAFDREDRRDFRDDLRDLRRDCNERESDLRELVRDLDRVERDLERDLRFRGGSRLGLARLLFR